MALGGAGGGHAVGEGAESLDLDESAVAEIAEVGKLTHRPNTRLLGELAGIDDEVERRSVGDGLFQPAPYAAVCQPAGGVGESRGDGKFP